MAKSNSFKNSVPHAAKLGFFTAVLALLGGLGACQRSPSPNPAITNPPPGLKLGVLVPTTGALGAASQSSLEVLPLIASTVNACGGVNNAPVSLVVEEDPLNPKAEAGLIKKLATEDQVDAVISVLGTEASTMAVLETLVPYKIPLISSTNTASAFTERSQKGDLQGLWSRTVPTDTQQAIALAKLAKNRGFRTASTVVVNNSGGIRFEKAFIAAFEKLGGTVLNKSNPTRYDPQGASFDNDALSAFRPNDETPDAVIADLNPDTGNLLLQSAEAQGLVTGVQLLLSDRIRNPTSLSLTGTKLVLPEGAIGIATHPRGGSDSSFLKNWQQSQDSPPGLYASQTWDAAALLMLAAEAAKSNQAIAISNKLQEVANAPGVEVTDICEALQSLREGKEINYQGASGEVDLDENGDVSSLYQVWTVDMQGKIRDIGQVEPSP
ncbi:MAG: ABC transporter substrate-binding protein [Drouetiella hepatica Uher 2000/2452]|uniref:ABC transporter substrate-binding protein n=1 Tax=Drouetiella hepatica Uher 2000/2452 TaxID=904376 RepID=A0A951UM56_9CYAN|nr:ABC transporter substrate-binding protein [Drouetiella hepatica Uher 2000/2452]